MKKSRIFKEIKYDGLNDRYVYTRASYSNEGDEVVAKVLNPLNYIHSSLSHYQFQRDLYNASKESELLPLSAKEAAKVAQDVLYKTITRYINQAVEEGCDGVVISKIPPEVQSILKAAGYTVKKPTWCFGSDRFTVKWSAGNNLYDHYAI